MLTSRRRLNQCEYGNAHKREDCSIDWYFLSKEGMNHLSGWDTLCIEKMLKRPRKEKILYTNGLEIAGIVGLLVKSMIPCTISSIKSPFSQTSASSAHEHSPHKIIPAYQDRTEGLT